MTPLDWLILWVPIVVVIFVAMYTARFNRSVADFIAAGRCAGRYLLATAQGEAGSAAITAIALFQMTTHTGFAFQFWAPLYASIPILVTIFGWVIYRYRETRALSGGQFFEMRYSRSFRLFMGVVGFISGVMNYGVFPAVSSRFFVYYLDLPQTVTWFHLAFPTWQLIALAYLTCCLFFVLTGGQISILISDCLEGLFSQVAYVILIIALLLIFGWHRIVEGLLAAPPHQSMVNPFDMGKTQDFNIYFILIGLIGAVYNVGVGGGFAASALNPHELRMAGILGRWRGFGFGLMRTILAICAVTFLIHPAFAGSAASAHAQLNGIADEGIRSQMTVPVAAGHFLPAGLKGLFCAIMLMGVLTGDARTSSCHSGIFRAKER
jgi:SSS family solute:Na+ symporter